MSQVYTSFSLLAQVSITRRGIANRAPPREVPINADRGQVESGAKVGGSNGRECKSGLDLPPREHPRTASQNCTKLNSAQFGHNLESFDRVAQSDILLEERYLTR